MAPPSCLNPLFFARSGYGVYLRAAHPKTYHDKLEGASQSTYRSELRAIVHVLEHAATDILVRSDCKSVVDGFNKIMNGIPMAKNNDDYDLWNYAQSILNILGEIDIKIEWMRSHLSESGQEHKKKKYLERGGTLEAIAGNGGAEDLAKKGASLHHKRGIRHYLAEARTDLTKIIQNMMAEIWMLEVKHRFPNDPKKAISHEDNSAAANTSSYVDNHEAFPDLEQGLERMQQENYFHGNFNMENPFGGRHRHTWGRTPSRTDNRRGTDPHSGRTATTRSLQRTTTRGRYPCRRIPDTQIQH